MKGFVVGCWVPPAGSSVTATTAPAGSDRGDSCDGCDRPRPARAKRNHIRQHIRALRAGGGEDAATQLLRRLHRLGRVRERSRGPLQPGKLLATAFATREVVLVGPSLTW